MVKHTVAAHAERNSCNGVGLTPAAHRRSSRHCDQQETASEVTRESIGWGSKTTQAASQCVACEGQRVSFVTRRYIVSSDLNSRLGFASR